MLIGRALRRVCPHLPPKVQYVLGDVYAHVFRTHTFAGKLFPRYWRSFRRTEWADRETLERVQWEKFRRLLHHAYEHVGFYRRRLDAAGVTPDDIRTYEDLTRIPVLTKDEVRAQPEALLADGVRPEELIPKETTGVTGAPLRVWQDLPCHVAARAAVARWRTRAGCDGLRDRGAATGRFFTRKGDPRKPPFTWYDPVDNVLYLPSRNTSSEALAEYVERLRCLAPKFLQGVTSTLYILACYVLERGIDDIRPISVLPSGDMLLPTFREVIQTAFGCEVFESYGMIERVVSAGECEEHHGMHVDMEQCVVEVLDADGRQVFDRTGEIVGTNLENYAMPFIRYRTGDLGRLSRRRCPCGRSSILVEEIEGRRADFIVTSDGDVVGCAGVVNMLRSLRRLKECQVRQTRPGAVQVLAAFVDGYTAADVEAVVDALHDGVGEDLSVEVQVVERVPRGPGGKLRLVVSEVEGRFIRPEKGPGPFSGTE